MMKENLNTLSDRLIYALELTGTKKADLARAIEVKPQIIQHLCTGGVQASRFTFEVATVLGLNTRWLATGEGEMFLADDPKHKMFKGYKEIPILSNDQLISLAENSAFEENYNQETTILKTQDTGLFCVMNNDVSMEPFFPLNSLLFFKEKIGSERRKFKSGDIVIAYLPQFHSVMVRSIINTNDCFYLSPMNKSLFKEIIFTDDIIIFGEAIECHFRVNKR